MADVARTILQPLGRVAADRTGLKGRYESQNRSDALYDGVAEGKDDITTILFAGFQEQLELKLEPGKE
jgi:uncharacterized protein (TIGR03435 family)